MTADLAETSMAYGNQGVVVEAGRERLLMHQASGISGLL